MEQTALIELNLPAEYRFLNVLGAVIAALMERIEGLVESEILIHNLQLAVQEACANIVDHAYADQPDGRIQVVLTLELTPRCLIIELDDFGQPFDPALISEPNLDEAQEGGYGLFLMRHLLDEMIYQPQADGNHWRLVKNL
jgi:serine/threonine-protein kinase RsbW